MRSPRKPGCSTLNSHSRFDKKQFNGFLVSFKRKPAFSARSADESACVPPAAVLQTIPYRCV
jgi:hypothetical protein